MCCAVLASAALMEVNWRGWTEPEVSYEGLRRVLWLLAYTSVICFPNARVQRIQEFKNPRTQEIRGGREVQVVVVYAWKSLPNVLTTRCQSAKGPKLHPATLMAASLDLSFETSRAKDPTSYGPGSIPGVVLGSDGNVAPPNRSGDPGHSYFPARWACMLTQWVSTHTNAWVRAVFSKPKQVAEHPSTIGKAMSSQATRAIIGL